MGLLIDNFAGGGGASKGIQQALGRPVDIAINHDLKSIRMHRANHPETIHFAENVWDVDPVEVCQGHPVWLGWFSPDCTHHSKAKGGAPFRDKRRARRIRGLAWIVVRWIEALKPLDHHPILIGLENVEEFQKWGPLIEVAPDVWKPDPDRIGETFNQFVGRLVALGYTVEWRELVASDYGAPTSRKRLFLLARRDGKPIVWPEPTHGPGREYPYRTAAECIDWTQRMVSVFATKEEAKELGEKVVRPLAENTLKRVARGLQRFLIDANDPYLLDDEKTAAFMALHYTGKVGYDLRRPLNTITQRDHHTPVAVHLVRHFGNSVGSSLDNPMPTIMAGGAGKTGVVSANLITIDNGSQKSGGFHSINAPLSTIIASNPRHAIVAPYLVKYYGTGDGQRLRDPMHTITTKDRFGLVGLSLIPITAEGNRHIAAGGFHFTEITELLIEHIQISDPKKRWKVQSSATRLIRRLQAEGFEVATEVEVKGERYAIADIGLRMLQPHELAKAQGFPDDYKLIGTKTDVIGRIGNSVPPQVVAAMVRANAPEEFFARRTAA